MSTFFFFEILELGYFKGVPMLESGSALEDETLTTRFTTLENPEIFGRKYPVAHLEEIMANLPFTGLNSFNVG